MSLDSITSVIFYSKLQKMLLKHEGLKLKPYEDTRGNLTIGIGRNLSDVGISVNEALAMLNNDVVGVTDQLTEHYPWFIRLNIARQDALIDMVFNLGFMGFNTFSKLIFALSQGDWEVASAEMLSSLWAKQVGDRAKELAQMILSGEYQEL